MARRGLTAVVCAGLVLAACSSNGTATEADPTTGVVATDTVPAATATSEATSSTEAAPTTTTTPASASASASTTPASPTPASTATTTPPSLVPPRADNPALYPALPPQPDGVPFPTEEWPTGELPAGVSVAAIDAAVATAFGADDTPTRVRSLVVVQGGRIVYERYHPLDDADTPTSSWSVAKSFTSAAIGLLAGDGRLDPLAPAPLPEWSDPADPRGAITVADLLHMSSGLEWNESFDPNGESDVLTMLQVEDAAAYTIDKPLVADPGTLFNYSTGTSAVLSRILSDTVGGDEAAIDFVTSRLLEPIGITSLQFRRDPHGRWFGGLGADGTPRDFARFGLLYLRDGVWDGQRILPAGWVDYTRTPSPSLSGYGAHWWLTGPPGSFSALGLFGQQIIVVPELDLVLVTTSTQGGDPQTLTDAVHELFADAAA
ncbi:MAG: serine hydrolase domain-containing protein [Acidimicrobiia bacterium]